MDRISEDINKQEMEKVYEGKLEYSTQVHKAHKKVNEGALSEEYSTVLGIGIDQHKGFESCEDPWCNTEFRKFR